MLPKSWNNLPLADDGDAAKKGEYTDLTELTPYALRELIKAVYVEAPDKSSGKRKQRVHIEYDLVGYIPVDELIKAEQA